MVAVIIMFALPLPIRCAVMVAAAGVAGTFFLRRHLVLLGLETGGWLILLF